MSRSKDIAEILGLTEAENTTNASLGDGSGGGSVTTYATPANLPTSGNTSGDQAFVTSNNRLYIWNGSGWYNIALVNTNPSFSSSPDGTYELATDGSTTTITLVATDPEGVPITYTTTADAGFDGLATVSNDSSVFTITPKSAEAATTTSGNLTFKASDGVNIASAISEFTLVFTVVNSNFTSLLAKASGNAGTNSTFTDGSTNSLTITAVGNAHSTAFTPFHTGGYSTYFDGSGDYLTVAQSNDFNLSGEFTVEMWVYLDQTSYARTIQRLVTSANTGYTAEPYISIGNDTGGVNAGCLCFSSSVGAGNPQGYATTEGTGATGTNLYFPFKQWVHVALTRDSSNVCRLFQDGKKVATVTISGGFDFNGAGDNGLSIAKSGWATTEYFGPGYIRDFRIVKGTSVYTANFTPPTATLTAVTNTKLLTCHLPYIGDKSTSNHSVTPYGNTSTERFGPYDYLAYNASTHASSVYLDGTGDKLTIPADTQLAADNGGFTFETWIYPTAFTSYDMIVSMGTQSSTFNYTLFVHNTTQHLMFEAGTGDWSSTTYTSGVDDGIVKLNQWQHIAVVYDSNQLTIYRNGKVAIYQASPQIATGHTGTFALGDWMNTGNYPFTGYIANARIVQSAVYSNNTAFTPPTEPLTAITNTGMLLTASPSIYNASGSEGKFALTGNLQSSTTQTKNASSSMHFDGTGDYLTVGTSSGFTYGTGDFTIEGWVYVDNNPGNYAYFLGQGGTVSSTASIGMYIQGGVFKVYNNGVVITGTTSYSLDTWYHVALVRGHGQLTLFLNGSVEGTAANTNSISSGSTMGLSLGRWAEPGDSGYFNGYLEDFRVTKGFARYPFIPTQETLTAVSNTELLAAHASTLVDGSGNSATLTAAGNAAVSTFGPYSGMNSIYFDGSGDYVTSSRSSSDMGIGTGDFTIECWFYDDGSASDRGIWESRATSSSTGMTLTRVDSNTIRVWTTSQQLATADVTLANTWNHLAVVRNSGTLELFLNGQSQGTVSNSTTFADTADFVIGGGRYAGGGVDRTIKGYISNFRIVKSALYANSFTPPTDELEG
jgi:hypothetical protein